jgi:DNA-directed RNA polymerase specialized sigma24 family protein
MQGKKRSTLRKSGSGQPAEQDLFGTAARKMQRTTAGRTISPALRTTFQLRHIDSLSIHEAALTLGLPCGTIKAQLVRTRKKLKESLRRALKPRTQNTLCPCTPSKRSQNPS